MCRIQPARLFRSQARTSVSSRSAALFLAVVALALAPVLARAQTSAPVSPSTTDVQSAPPVAPVPNGFQGATVQYKYNAQVPLDLTFVDEAGKKVQLQQYFHGKPVILAMVYYGCPMLCGLTMNGLLEGIRPMSLKLGTDYEIVTVSFNPKESPDIAREKKKNFVQSLGTPDAATGWHFLTSSSDDSPRALGDAIGFGYKLDPSSGQYLHQAAIYICMPDGRVSRMIPDVRFDTDVLHDSLINASQGKLGSPIFKFAQSCGIYDFDPATGKYVTRAKNVMRLGGLLTILVLGALLGRLWYQDAHKKPPSPGPGSKTAPDPDSFPQA